MHHSHSPKIFSLAVLLAFGCLVNHHTAARVVEAGTNKTAMRAEGAALFADKGCAHCHGPSGFGGSDTGPDLSQVRKQLKPDQIAHQIHDGGKNMPPFGDSLSEDEIASLVEYLHSKRKPPPGWSKPRPTSNIPGVAPAPVPSKDQDL